ncbi:MAG TPA: DUF2284 domain-containing protein [Clostridia bacterium]|nr:MAG: hypothetical protein BWX97_01833 [Firmicutes bacterium ADurb.Bin146]HOD92730.1 DUF2284 domain-containing protein [Clostridia bacterium]
MEYSVENFKVQAKKFGFSNASELNTNALVFMPEVRQMCNSDLCHSYNKNWMCPPAIGSLENASQKVKDYSFGMIVQTTAQMEDEFDYETIQSTETKHKHNFQKLITELKKEYPEILPMSSGTCSICNKCTYPEQPCRFPDKAFGSMESYGLWVSKVCELSSIPYYYGKNTLTFTSCYLLK